jgi:uncharacterized protein (TIGR00661 family)
MQQPKRILVCPLDWGLGHATRCIPIIRYLLEKKTEVLIAADGRPLALLKQEFPEQEFVQLKGYDIDYSGTLPMALKMAVSVPRLLRRIREEEKELATIVEQKKIDVVISDNRYGCHYPKTRNIFITHQLMIKSPIGEKQLHKKVLGYLKRYDECWIPDTSEENNLSGDLSHKFELPENVYFVGPLSRFVPAEHNTRPVHDIMAIVSGPEPQRSIFEKMVIEEISKNNLRAFIARGIPEQSGNNNLGNIRTYPHLVTAQIQEEILNSKIVLSRPGYSTAMDLAALGMKAIFVPTPGQTEQEYLAEYYKKKGIAFCQKQSEFDLAVALKESINYKGFEPIKPGGYKKRIDLLLE